MTTLIFIAIGIAFWLGYMFARKHPALRRKLRLGKLEGAISKLVRQARLKRCMRDVRNKEALNTFSYRSNMHISNILENPRDGYAPIKLQLVNTVRDCWETYIKNMTRPDKMGAETVFMFEEMGRAAAGVSTLLNLPEGIKETPDAQLMYLMYCVEMAEALESVYILDTYNAELQDDGLPPEDTVTEEDVTLHGEKADEDI